MEGVPQKKKNWVDMDSDDDEEEEQQQSQQKEEKKEDKQEKVIETKVQQSQGEHNKRENENVSAQNNEEFGYINEKRRGQINERDNHNNNGQRQSEQFSRRNDDNRNNNNNHYHRERDGNNERRDKYTQIHAQNCAELVEALEKEHQGDSVWINCFYMGQNNPIEKEELQKAFHGINFLQFDSEKDKYDNYIANIKISVGDAKKISPDQPPMYKGMYFKIRYGAKNQYNNHHQNNQEKRSGKQQYGRNNDEERNNNANREPAFNMKRNDNNVGKVDPVASKPQQGKKDLFFVEKSENHENERPSITNSKKKHEEEQEMKKQKNQDQDKEQTESFQDSHKGTGSTHYGEKDSLESDKIQTHQGKSNHDTAVDSIKKIKEDKTHGDKQSSQQHQQQQQQQTNQKTTTERVSKNRGFNKQSEQSSKEGGHKESKKEEGKAPNAHIVWVEKEVEEKKIPPVDNNELSNDIGSSNTDKSEPSQKE